MNGEMVQTDSGVYVRCQPGEMPLACQQDLLDLLPLCYEAGVNQIMLEQAHLHPDFFDLKTGLAGALFLKLTTYGVKTAVLLLPATPLNDRFQELVHECNRRGDIRFFYNRREAESWLTR
jgi:hypothetical protein